MSEEIKEVVLRIEVAPTDLFSDVMDAMTTATHQLISNEAMEFPVHIAALASNGSGLLARITRHPDRVDGSTTILAQHDEAEGYKLPVHMLVMDSTGYTSRVIVTTAKTGA
jgi:hypothetical protein